jgi:DNA-binding NarL/FixJ family response regulator
MSVRVGISDPLPMYRYGIMATLSDSGFDLEAPEDLMAWIHVDQDKMILLTVASHDDWALLTQLHQARDEIPIVAALDDRSTSASVRALTAGAVGVVPRDASPSVIREALNAVVCGRSVVPIEVLRALTARNSDVGPAETPSSREIEWLIQLAGGLTVGQLATRVGYSERVMFRLLRDLYDRLQVKGRTQALMLARDRGWL